MSEAIGAIQIKIDVKMAKIHFFIFASFFPIFMLFFQKISEDTEKLRKWKSTKTEIG